MTSFINKFFPFNNSSKPIVLERRKMEEVVAICQQLKGFLQQKIVKARRFAPRCNVTGVVILSDRGSGVEGPSWQLKRTVQRDKRDFVLPVQPEKKETMQSSVPHVVPADGEAIEVPSRHRW
jgi:hypothetical protein